MISMFSSGRDNFMFKFCYWYSGIKEFSKSIIDLLCGLGSHVVTVIHFKKVIPGASAYPKKPVTDEGEFPVQINLKIALIYFSK